MDKAKFDVAILVGKFLANNLTEEEKAYLSDWLSSSEKNRAWFERVTSESYQIEKGKATRSINVEEGWKALELKRESRMGGASPSDLLDALRGDVCLTSGYCRFITPSVLFP
ncbi:MAG: hypothetical protein BHV81_16865 [Butyricimonas synergistica]|nr:MAG: hypothetical protein BHV81_16865 [Butyricimonas synergistica]